MTELELFIQTLEQMAGFVGAGNLVSVIVAILKRFGIVKDGQSMKWVQVLNFASFAVIIVLYFVGVDADWSSIDEVLMNVSKLLGLVLQLLGSKLFYKLFKGTPIVGFSYSPTE